MTEKELQEDNDIMKEGLATAIIPENIVKAISAFASFKKEVERLESPELKQAIGEMDCCLEYLMAIAREDMRRNWDCAMAGALRDDDTDETDEVDEEYLALVEKHINGEITFKELIEELNNTE